MFLREMNSVRGLWKKKYSLGTKKPRTFLELEGQRAKIIDPLNMWNEWLAMASSSALEVWGFSLESDFMSHPIKGSQMWSAFTSPPGSPAFPLPLEQHYLQIPGSNFRSSFGLRNPEILFSGWSFRCDSGLDCMYFLHWAGDGKGEPLSKHRPKSSSSQPLARPPGHHTSTMSLLSESPLVLRTPTVLVETRTEDWRLFHLPGLALEHRMGTFSEDMVQITEFP